KANVLPVMQQIVTRLQDIGIRLHVDLREGLSPGFKYNDWEMRGVPLRIEIGPKDVEKGTVALARRDIAGREGKQFVEQAILTERVPALLAEIQASLLQQATEFRNFRCHEV